MNQINAAQRGVTSPYMNDPAVRRAARVAGSAGIALGAILLACAAGLVVLVLAQPRYWAVLVIALLPAVLGFGLFTSSRQILRGELAGAGKATVVLFPMAGLPAVGTISAFTAGDFPPAIGMGAFVVIAITLLVLVHRAERALKGQ